MFKHVYRLLASLKLAVILLVVLASVLAWATFLEADKGREYAQWHVYGSRWFVALLALLGLNILAAALIRFPWKTRQFGFVVTHAGLLVLLAGSIQTFLLGIEGQLSLREGQQAEEILLIDRSVITVVREAAGARVSTDFAFTPGPDDWPDGKHLDFGDLNALGLKVLKFYRHARQQTDWVADETDYQGPALRLQLTGPGGHTVAEQWLTATVFGGEVVIGPTKYQLLPIPCDSMAEDFREPPAVEPGSAGVLSVHHEGQVYRVSVDEKLGQKVPLGQSGVAVEVVEYLANAQPMPDGRFISRGNQAANPLLELMIHEPDRDAPTRQVAFARLPLLNLDAVHGRSSPVKFWYHHPGTTHPPGAVFLQTPDGTLYCRPVNGGALGPAQQVKEGGTIPIAGQFAITVADHLKRARQELSFTAVELAAGQTNRPEAAALIEVTINGHSRQVWLKRHDQQFGMQQIVTSQGPIVVGFGYEQLPLGYRIELHDFVRRLNPGRMGNAAFASTVRLIDPVSDVDQQREISMNEPLSHGKFTFYQSSFQELPGGVEASVLTAAYDPGRTLKYLGSLMICAGTFIMFYMRAYMFQSVPRLVNRGRKPDAAGPGEHREEAQDGASPDTVSGTVST